MTTFFYYSIMNITNNKVRVFNTLFHKSKKVANKMKQYKIYCNGFLIGVDFFTTSQVAKIENDNDIKLIAI